MGCQSCPKHPVMSELSDLFQLAAYLALLFHLVSRITRDVAEGASAEERKRLSRDLHDGLAQNLSVLNMRLNEAIRVCPDPAAASLGRNLQASRRLAQAALFEARHAITALRTGSIGWDDCVEALETLCNEWAQNLEVDIRLRVEGTLAAVNADLHVELLRILNEAISNAVRHGEAARIEVWLAVEARPTRLILRVQDDGHGFPACGSPIGTGVGLRSLAERLERRRGVLTLQSCPADGTVVQVEIPVSVRHGRAT